MADRPLSADEQALWARVAATVTPIKPQPRAAAPVVQRRQALADLTLLARQDAPATPDAPRRPVKGRPLDTLDGGWDRRLRRGTVKPDRSLDLHGHTLASARATLDRALEEAVADGTRVLLIVTGKPPRAGEGRRGLIRASIFDWIARSRHADAIAAVRNAHPRHGGAGALYLILRRRRGE